VTYHSSIQALVAHLETLRPALLAKGYDLELAPSGQNTTRGSLGVTLAAVAPGGERHTFAVEEAGAADRYVRVALDGRVVTRTEAIGQDLVPYGIDLVAFKGPHVDQFVQVLPDRSRG
jgi:hypothetical protein